MLEVISAVLKESITRNKIASRKDCLTTTELAKLCGVSRFTAINWVNRGKIKTMKTVGGHSRIPISEAISFYEAFHNEKSGVKSESFLHCWQYPRKTNCYKDCEGCLLYKSRINYCFVAVREFGRELIHCRGDCLSCDYFEEFFNSYTKNAQFDNKHQRKDKKLSTDKKSFLYNFIYGVGRGVHGVKETVADIKEVLGRKGFRTRNTEKADV